MEPEVLRGPLLENKTVVINEHLDSFGQCLSTKSDDYLIRTIRDFAQLDQGPEGVRRLDGEHFIRPGQEDEGTQREVPQASPDQPRPQEAVGNDHRPGIDHQGGRSAAAGADSPSQDPGQPPRGPPALYLRSAQTGISSVSDMKHALETAELYADVVQLPSFSFLSTSSAPAPNAPTPSQEVIEISSDDEEPFDFASADDVARQFMQNNTD